MEIQSRNVAHHWFGADVACVVVQTGAPRGSVAQYRVRETLGAIARPILLSGTSTLLAVALMGNVHSYMIRTFLKTIFLVWAIPSVGGGRSRH